MADRAAPQSSGMQVLSLLLLYVDLSRTSTYTFLHILLLWNGTGGCSSSYHHTCFSAGEKRENAQDLGEHFIF